MDITIAPGSLTGTIPAITSKSMAHRLFILAATVGLAGARSALVTDSTNDDMQATLRCLEALGATTSTTGNTLCFETTCARDRGTDQRVTLPVGESGSTLRFLVPVVAALGRHADFVCEGRLSKRPLTPLDRELLAHGARCTWEGNVLHLDGTLASGRFTLPGDVSSQFASGLLLAAPILQSKPESAEAPFELLVAKPVESLPYIDLTVDALAQAGYTVSTSDVTMDDSEYLAFTVSRTADTQTCDDAHSDALRIEGDWSNAAFWLCADALGAGSVVVSGLNKLSRQGDRAVVSALAMLGAQVISEQDSFRAYRAQMHATMIDVRNIPDLVPPLAAVAATTPGTTRFTGAGRLRLKESDRLQTVSDAITRLGGVARIVDDELHVSGVEQLDGGTVDAAGDHRIAMMAAICALTARHETTIVGAECVAKSYPRFFEDLRALGGTITVQEG